LEPTCVCAPRSRRATNGVLRQHLRQQHQPRQPGSAVPHCRQRRGGAGCRRRARLAWEAKAAIFVAESRASQTSTKSGNCGWALDKCSATTTSCSQPPSPSSQCSRSTESRRIRHGSGSATTSRSASSGQRSWPNGSSLTLDRHAIRASSPLASRLISGQDGINKWTAAHGPQLLEHISRGHVHGVHVGDTSADIGHGDADPNDLAHEDLGPAGRHTGDGKVSAVRPGRRWPHQNQGRGRPRRRRQTGSMRSRFVTSVAGRRPAQDRVAGLVSRIDRAPASTSKERPVESRRYTYSASSSMFRKATAPVWVCRPMKLGASGRLGSPRPACGLSNWVTWAPLSLTV
jgi:hypothetical protein